MNIHFSCLEGINKFVQIAKMYSQTKCVSISADLRFGLPLISSFHFHYNLQYVARQSVNYDATRWNINVTLKHSEIDFSLVDSVAERPFFPRKVNKDLSICKSGGKLYEYSRGVNAVKFTDRREGSGDKPP